MHIKRLKCDFFVTYPTEQISVKCHENTVSAKII